MFMLWWSIWSEYYTVSWVTDVMGSVAPAYVLTPIKTMSVHWRQVNWTRGSTAHPQRAAGSRIFVLPWNKFHLKAIRFSICDCQLCLVTTWARWLFLHKLMKRHYSSLTSSSPSVSRGFITAPLFLDFNCKEQLDFPPEGSCCPPSPRRTLTAQHTYYIKHFMTDLKSKGELITCI